MYVPIISFCFVALLTSPAQSLWLGSFGIRRFFGRWISSAATDLNRTANRDLVDHPVIKFAPNAYMHIPEEVERKTSYLIGLKLFGKPFAMEGYYSNFYGPFASGPQTTAQNRKAPFDVFQHTGANRRPSVNMAATHHAKEQQSARRRHPKIQTNLFPEVTQGVIRPIPKKASGYARPVLKPRLFRLSPVYSNLTGVVPQTKSLNTSRTTNFQEEALQERLSEKLSQRNQSDSLQFENVSDNVKSLQNLSSVEMQRANGDYVTDAYQIDSSEESISTGDVGLLTTEDSLETSTLSSISSLDTTWPTSDSYSTIVSMEARTVPISSDNDFTTRHKLVSNP